MKITITKRHIKAALDSNGKRTPVELAVMDEDCFEDVRLLGRETQRFMLDLDGNRIQLPAKVKKSLNAFFAEEKMKPFSFELPVEMEFGIDDGEFSLDVFQDMAFGY